MPVATTTSLGPVRYVHLPTTVDAMHYLPQTRGAVRRWLTAAGAVWWSDMYEENTRIQTPQGPRVATYGTWVIRGIVGEWYVVWDQVFRNAYAEAATGEIGGLFD